MDVLFFFFFFVFCYPELSQSWGIDGPQISFCAANMGAARQHIIFMLLVAETWTALSPYYVESMSLYFCVSIVEGKCPLGSRI